MVYSKDELYATEPRRTYSGEAKEAAFLLGGIGTGNVSLGSRGELRDWELFNRPGKRNRLPNTYFAIWAQQDGEAPIAKVLESALMPPHISHDGYHPDTGAGLPRLASSVLKGEYPIASVEFEDNELPVQVSLQAFTPFIPLDEDDSGIPGAYLTYRVSNSSGRPVNVTIAGSVMNPIGIQYTGYGEIDFSHTGQNVNDFRQEEGLAGLYLDSRKYAEGDLRYGNVSLVTTNKSFTYKSVWLRGAWFDNLQEFWDDFAVDGLLEDLGSLPPSRDGSSDTASLGVRERLEPGETKEFRFILAWYFPNRINGWNERIRVKQAGRDIVQNEYARRFDSSWAAASYLVRHAARLERDTLAFRDALFGSSLPAYVLDCIANNITVLRSTTCFRLADGRFLAYEGCLDHTGSCEGNCTHVWNYAQTLAFLFPRLEQNMRRMELLEELMDDGKMNFRAYRLFEYEWLWRGEKGTPAAADGQMGSILRVYREWKLSGDDAFLRELWPAVKKALAFAFTHWDSDGDFVLEGKQHNTYDIEFYGPNPLTGILVLAALRASRELALYLGETDTAMKYEQIFAVSSQRLDERLWNGEYYVQQLDDVNAYKYQHGLGCLSDQLLGQQLAHLYGLGYLLPRDRIRSAIQSVYKYNYKTNFTHHVNCQRSFVLNDEKGLLLCSWPQGGRPRLPFVYSDEVWTGIEYQVATNLVYEGFIDEALTLVRSVWERHDGFRRNPWNEVECGNHYARAMASWGLLLAFSGFAFDMVRGEIAFDPVINRDHFTTFWSTGRAWGTFSQKKNPETNEYDVGVDVLFGDAAGITVKAGSKQWKL